MKYIVLLGDGMADEPCAALEQRTPLQVAQTPNMDRLADCGQLGLAHTVPEGYHPGSDVANLSVFGYDPARYYSGRAPLEAASMGIELAPEDVAFRLNLVWLEAHYGKLYMGDFSAGHISTEEATRLVNSLQEQLGDERFQFYPGISYRHLLVWRGGDAQMRCTPPHDISGQALDDYLPQGEGSAELIDLMNSSQMVLNAHPVNQHRINNTQIPANSAWFWGQGYRPKMDRFDQKYQLQGGVISAVDLIRGLGVCAGLEVIKVPGATGYIDTNYQGKGKAAVDLLRQKDFVYVHVEAPDEAAHAGLLEEKIKAIENFDRDVVGVIVDAMEELGDCRVLVLPDHPTPVARKTHTSDPVPYILFDSRETQSQRQGGYSEATAAATSTCCAGHQLMSQLLQR